MRNLVLYFHKYIFTVLFTGCVFIIIIESPLSIQLADFLTNNSIVEETLAQPAPSTNTSIITNNNPGEQNKSKMIKAFGHFANNQLKDGTQFAFGSGYQGTPTLIIENSNGTNQEVLVGAYPFPSLQVIIDKKLAGG